MRDKQKLDVTKNKAMIVKKPTRGWSRSLFYRRITSDIQQANGDGPITVFVVRLCLWKSLGF